MPTITLVAVPQTGATAYDGATDTIFIEGVPTFVDDPTVWERLKGLYQLGYRFAVVDNAEPAPLTVGYPADVQAPDPPAPQES